MKLWIFALALLLISPVFADLTANATISPRFVDTNVINQTFVYTITPLNNETINRTVIYAPAGYEITGIQSVTLNSTSCLGVGCAGESNSSEIAINFTTVDPVNNVTNTPVKITFLVNTSSSSKIGNFTSLLNNTVFENSTTVVGVNDTQVVTQQMINVTAVAMAPIDSYCTTCKATAIANGTDYWEFRFTVSFLASQAGLVQFRMNDWLDAVGSRMNINTSTLYHATLRNESNFNTTGKFNVTTTYGNNVGINSTSIPSSYLYLRMIIPSGTISSNSWSTAYSFLFRAIP